ncbi:hypothetical protein [Granulosicoccus antarcticus]|uniref:Uncharacterized protein n=1 Tax=Granulosicoccus antarcticus IMCC3135 TaxID=1192854 RepID=A0A2Z2NRL8_9GAMM|nr:hypothetical protein [Granulosicoccus antarcticus]ASJ74102.1 hypothetical protein IMCC3135_20120 [Granulosicoccus antarcticus IMCC3135]
MNCGNTLIQTTEKPFSTLKQATEFLELVGSELAWTGAGVIYDKEPGAILFLLLVDEAIVCVFRCALALDDTVAIATLMVGSTTDEFIIASTPGLSFPHDDVRSLEKLNEHWGIAQSAGVSIAELHNLFDSLFKSILTKGRGANIKTDTRNQVLLDSHGRCMFDGCSVDLTIDHLTGKTGNYKTLAHNVASSEQGARGVVYLSNELSNKPENILVLCDVHHRLVDSVAKAEYPAHVITDMRSRFCNQAKNLLDSMRYEPMPAICVCWPVRDDQFSLPTEQQIAESLKPLKARWSGEFLPIVEKDETLRSMDQADRWRVSVHGVGIAFSDYVGYSEEKALRVY